MFLDNELKWQNTIQFAAHVRFYDVKWIQVGLGLAFDESATITHILQYLNTVQLYYIQ